MKRFAEPGDFHTCGAGTRLWQIYFRAGPCPTHWNEFRSFGPTQSRFDHHTRPKRLQTRGVLYATIDIATALAEVFQDTRVIDRHRREPWLVGFELATDLRLLDTGGNWPLQAGGGAVINSGSRARARAWSRAIYASYPSSGGIWYPSSLTNRRCAVLYERSSAALPTTPAFNRPLTSPSLISGLSNLANQLNYLLH